MVNIAIILVAPQMGENIGAAARVMKNFGLGDLRIISPRDGWPNEKAQDMSVGAIDVINKAKIFSSIEEAIDDLSFIYATTGTYRDINKNYIFSHNVQDSQLPADNIGIMFGRENSGLSNSEISYANKILVIDTEQNFTSLNLAQAVGVVCYEFFKSVKKTDEISLDKQILVSHKELNYFYHHLFNILEKYKFFRAPEKKKYMCEKIRNLFAKIDNLSQSELQILYGIINLINKE